MRRFFRQVERLIWVFAGIACMWGAWDTYRVGGGLGWTLLLAACGIGFFAYTYYRVTTPEDDPFGRR